jgi:predicted TIM-barrel fold metal-dependent hydrolase
MLFSANSHFIEPAHVFQDRVPRHLAERAPRVIELASGGQAWQFEDQTRPLLQCTASAGTAPDTWSATKVMRFEELRKGVYDPVARLADMDLDGVDVTACYSAYTGMGFGGDMFFHTRDLELAHACVRAWNDWMHEEWAAADRRRFVAIGCMSYRDPVEAASEVRRNAARGFKGVLFRNPVDLGLPWTGSPVWEPFFRACEETGTVLVHHTNALAHWPSQPAAGEPRFPYGVASVQFQSSAMDALNSFLWAGFALRFPGLRILISESGGSWLPHLIRRLEWALDWSPLHAADWPDRNVRPSEAIARNYAFSTLELDQALALERDHGIGGWMLEDDYPHMESVWPHTLRHFDAQLAGQSAQTIHALKWGNGARLFRLD